MKAASAFLLMIWLGLACGGDALKLTGHGGQTGSNSLRGAFGSDGFGSGGLREDGASSSASAQGGRQTDSALDDSGTSDAGLDLTTCLPTWTDDAGLGECPCITQFDDLVSLMGTACSSVGLGCNYAVGCGVYCACGPSDGDKPLWSCLVPLCY